MPVLHSPPCAKDIRAIARKNLEGQWPLAVLVTFLAGLLGGQHGFSGGNASIDLPHAEIPLENIGDPQMWEKLLEELTTKWPAIVFAMVTSLAISAVFFIIGPCIHWGLCRFRLALVDGEQPTVGMLFQGFKSVFLKALGVQVLQSLIILACVLPFMLAGGITAGILILQLPRIHAYYLALTICVLLGLAGGVLAVIVQYRYAMSYYALVDNPELRATDALRESARMMKGNKWSAFCLDLGFIGWVLLSLFTCGIGALVLAPYTGQAQAVFYHHVSGRAAIREAVEELSMISEGL
jgi:uncharacterized membrane protein